MGSLRFARADPLDPALPMSDAIELDPALVRLVLAATSAESITALESVQQLWSGYGHIVRCQLAGAEQASVIVKHVRWPDQRDHPRGWATDRSHERKVQSYRVESRWYERHAARCRDRCRVPTGLAQETRPDGIVLVLEDLDATGFAGRRQDVGSAELDACLTWFAGFHATFVGEAPEGLWPTGTYWHLETRPDELEVMPDGPLKAAAARIDQRLAEARFQTFVHGDAKLANFCFDEAGQRAAAVDFQYVGGGCGMKDLAYFVSSCFDEDECERQAPDILDRYFDLLRVELGRMGRDVDVDALEAEWRELYPVAWTDFARFLQGWSPGHWKLHRYSDRLEREVLASLAVEDERWN